MNASYDVPADLAADFAGRRPPGTLALPLADPARSRPPIRAQAARRAGRSTGLTHAGPPVVAAVAAYDVPWSTDDFPATCAHLRRGRAANPNAAGRAPSCPGAGRPGATSAVDAGRRDGEVRCDRLRGWPVAGAPRRAGLRHSARGGGLCGRKRIRGLPDRAVVVSCTNRRTAGLTATFDARLGSAAGRVRFGAAFVVRVPAAASRPAGRPWPEGPDRFERPGSERGVRAGTVGKPAPPPGKA